jgi:hypothetical protein
MITRRALLELAGAGAAATALPRCTVAAEDSDELAQMHQSQDFALPPWHMWGTSQTLALDGALAEFKSQQLVKVNYARPENWRFLFAAQLDSVLVGGDTLDVLVDLIVGLGRSFVSLPVFWTHHFAGPANPGLIVWDTKDTSPALNQLIVAQDIQCSARLRGSFNPALTKRLTISAFFCPNVHIRPEWFAGQFRGNEDGGT